MKDPAEYQADIEALNGEILRLQAALAFYANQGSWADRPAHPESGCSGDEPLAYDDEGKRARAALGDARPPAWVCSSCFEIEQWALAEDEAAEARFMRGSM